MTALRWLSIALHQIPDAIGVAVSLAAVLFALRVVS
jgi:hypothetical protein